METTTAPDWLALSLGLAGGLGLFLIGMDQMTGALKALAGHRLQRILSTLSSNRVVGALTGSVTTAALQSSTITTVLTVGFVSAELLTLTQAASVIIGANLGTTVTAQLIALDVAQYALGLVAVGAILWLFVGNRTWREAGRALAALGLVFVGLQFMGDAMRPLATYEPVLDVLAQAGNPLVALTIGAVLTAIIQSSSATTGIVVSMAAAGLIDLPTGIAIILGANIGTCLTAVLAALGKNRDAMRTAMIHVLVNLLGALLWLILLTPLTSLIDAISGDPTAMASPRELANAHTIFNVANTVIFLILLTPLVALTRVIVREPRAVATPTDTGEFSYLDPDVTDTATLGLAAAQREIMRLADDVRDFLDTGFRTVVADAVPPDDVITQPREALRARYRDIMKYLGSLSGSDRDEEQDTELLAVVREADELGYLIDLIGESLVRVTRRRRRDSVSVPHAAALLHLLDDVTPALDLRAEAADFDLDEREAAARRLTRQLTVRADVETYVVESDLLTLLDRVRSAAARLQTVRVRSTDTT